MEFFWLYVIIGSTIIGLVGCGVVLWIFSNVKKGLKQKFEKIADSINGKVKISGFGTAEIQGDYQDIPFKIKFIRGGRYSPPDIRIEIFKKPPFELSLRREKFDTKIGKKIGLAKELQIGIPDFDEEFFIKTDDKLRCQSYLSEAKIREIIKNMYEKGWHLEFTKEGIELTKSLTPPRKGLGISLPSSLIEEEEIIELLKETGFSLVKSLE